MKGSVRVLVFDFDGVIVDSEGAKRAAWYELLKGARDPNGFSWENTDHDALITEAYRVWINGTAKGSRFEMIAHMMDAVKYPKTKEAIEWYAEEFNRLVQEAILKAGVLPETTSALEALFARFPLYLNSGTPEAALLQSARALHIEHFFKAILGKTEERKEKSKVQNIMRAMTCENASPAETVFVGDAVSDYKAALEAGCLFIRYTAFDPKREEWREGNPMQVTSLAQLVSRFS